MWGRYFDTRLSPMERINSLSPEDRWLTKLIDNTVHPRDGQVFADVVAEGLRRGRPAASWPRFRSEVIDRFQAEIVADRLSQGQSTAADDLTATQAARSEAAELTRYVFLRHHHPLANQPLAIALATGSMARAALEAVLLRQGFGAEGGQPDSQATLEVALPFAAGSELPHADSGIAEAGAFLDDSDLAYDEMDPDEAESRRVFEDFGAWAPDMSDYFVLDAGFAEDRGLCWQITSRTQWTFDPDGRWTTPGSEDDRVWVVDVATRRSGEWILDRDLHGGMFDSSEDAYQHVDEIIHADDHITR